MGLFFAMNYIKFRESINRPLFGTNLSNINWTTYEEWDKNIKNYRNTALKREKINTPSSSQVIQPLYKTSIEKWKNYENFFDNSHVYLEKWIKYFNY